MESTFKLHSTKPTCISANTNKAAHILPGIRKGCDVVRLGHLGDKDFIEGVRAQAPMVLVDLNGHAGPNRLAAIVQGLAPVQVCHLKTPLTT